VRQDHVGHAGVEDLHEATTMTVKVMAHFWVEETGASALAASLQPGR
jgi:hypothetical protein